MNSRGIIIGVIIVLGIFLILLTQKGKGPQVRKAVMGLKAPEFTLLDKNGTSIKLSQFKGKTVFLHFWASWCKECKDELPAIQALYNRRKADPAFVFLSVVYREDPAKTRDYIRVNNYDIPVFTDPEARTARTYGVSGVPETFIIDPEGILQKRVIGPGRWEDPLN